MIGVLRDNMKCQRPTEYKWVRIQVVPVLFPFGQGWVASAQLGLVVSALCQGGSFQSDFWGELFRPDLFIFRKQSSY